MIMLQYNKIKGIKAIKLNFNLVVLPPLHSGGIRFRYAKVWETSTKSSEVYFELLWQMVERVKD